MEKSLLDTYTINLNEKAKKNQLDPIWGRQKELQKLTSIMIKRTKNNPIIIGEPGVGKTAIVEELARSIVNNTCHHDLSDREIRLLDLTGLIAGSKERGELETRLTELLKEIQEDENIVIMIDEIHTIAADKGNKAFENANGIICNILKPSLARGGFSCIGATTLDEYAQYFTKDKALDRRFQPVMLEEPSKVDTLEILKHIKYKYEEFHDCEVSEEALEQCIYLSDKYLFYRTFPDKAIDLLDESCSKIKVDLYNDKRGDKILKKSDVNDVLTQIMTVPIKLSTDIEKIKVLEKTLENSFFGQEKAVKTVIDTLKRHLVGFYNKNRPIASMMFVGPPGTGKTHLVNVLAEAFYDSKDKSVIRFDMSEFMTSNSVSTLIGAPPGYMGYEEKGLLTNQIKTNPYSIILFDEIEKAHPSIYNMLLQVIEDGVLSDNQGNSYSFKNAIIIFTSNVGFTNKSTEALGFDVESNKKPFCTYNRDNIMQELKYTFRPEFLNRMDCIIPFEYLSSDVVRDIANKMINDTIRLIHVKIGCQPVVSTATRERIIEIGTTKHMGARPLRHAVNTFIIDPVSEKVLENTDSIKHLWFII